LSLESEAVRYLSYLNTNFLRPSDSLENLRIPMQISDLDVDEFKSLSGKGRVTRTFGALVSWWKNYAIHFKNARILDMHL
jgi:hypothetical protein